MITNRADATLQTGSWDESPFGETEGGPKLTRALVTGTYGGDIEGTTTISFIMCYPDSASAGFSGLERVEGRIGERGGSFVLRHEGTFSDGEARTTLTVVPGSGTGELRGLRGEGSSVAPVGSVATIHLDYELV